MWASCVLGSTGGYLLGKVMGDIDLLTITLVVSVTIVIFVLSSYFTASIRDA
jgi:DNA-binding IscR family transcriptional regulator